MATPEETLALLYEVADIETLSMELYGRNPGWDGPDYSISIQYFDSGDDRTDIRLFNGDDLADCLRKAKAWLQERGAIAEEK